MKQLISTLLLVLCLTTINAQSTQFGTISAANSGCGITLTFNTITEYATDMMRIERSKDGGASYIQVGTAPGHQGASGFAGSGYSYTWTDSNPFNANGPYSGTFYYRVRTKKYDTYGPYAVSPAASVYNGNPCNTAVTNTLCTGAGAPYYWGYGFTPGSQPTTACTIPTVPMEVLGRPTQTITWTSSNPLVATVNSNNYLVPMNAGYTNLQATLPACGITLAPVRFDICPCNGHTVPYGLGGNWSGGVCQLWFSRLGAITTYTLEYVNLNTNVSGSQVITYTTSTYPFSGLPAMTPFKWRVAATTSTACTTTGFSDWNFVVQSGNCSAAPVTNMVASCSCGVSCAGSCGYERFNWTPISGSSTYEVTFQVFNPSTSASLPAQVFTTSSTPPSVWPVNNAYSLTGTGWRIHFKVRAQCIDGTWQPYSGWSPDFVL